MDREAEDYHLDLTRLAGAGVPQLSGFDGSEHLLS